MRAGEGKKKKLIGELFERLRQAEERVDILPFNNQQVRELCVKYGFENPYDATKFDSREDLPIVMQEEGWFILHLGGGAHAFVRGVGYHELEPLQEVKTLSGRGSLLDTLGVSEASAVSTMYNEGILHDFLLGDRDAHLGIHTARRSKFSFTFRLGKHRLRANLLQLESDGFFETEKLVSVIEFKTGRKTNFEIRQLFTPMKYFETFQKKRSIPRDCKVRLLYGNRYRSKYRKDAFGLYEYVFTDSFDFNSIRLLRSTEYSLTGGGYVPHVQP